MSSQSRQTATSITQNAAHANVSRHACAGSSDSSLKSERFTCFNAAWSQNLVETFIYRGHFPWKKGKTEQITFIWVYGLHSPAGAVGVAVRSVYFGLVVSCDERHQVHCVCLKTDLQLHRASDEIRQLLAHLGAWRQHACTPRIQNSACESNHLLQMCAVPKSRFMDWQGGEWCRNCVSINTDCQILHLPDFTQFVFCSSMCSAILVRNAYLHLSFFAVKEEES